MILAISPNSSRGIRSSFWLNQSPGEGPFCADQISFSGWWWLEPWIFYDFPIILGRSFYPNWRSPSFFRGVGLNHQFLVGSITEFTMVKLVKSRFFLVPVQRGSNGLGTLSHGSLQRGATTMNVWSEKQAPRFGWMKLGSRRHISRGNIYIYI